MTTACRVMGVLNVTPDSFSDGGKFFHLEQSLAHAWRMKSEGADILDIGAESTRPGAESISEEVEWKRLFPVLDELKRQQFPVPISLDTSKATIAQKAIEGNYINMVNDVEGLRSPEMVNTVKTNSFPVVMMHMYGKPRTMQQDYRYDDVVCDLIRFFEDRIEETKIDRSLVTIDPGLGFGKSVAHNLTILRRLQEFKKLKLPILIGASRKSFIGRVLQSTEPQDRLEGSLACASLAVHHGANILRVHDVKETKKVVTMVENIQNESV